MRALLSVYDKTGARRSGPGLVGPGLGAGLERRDVGGPGRCRHRPPRGGRPDRCPRDAGRSGQDPPSHRARRDPGRPVQAGAPGRSGASGHRAHRPGGVQPLSLHLGSVHRADRRGRADHGPGRGEEPCPRGHRGLTVDVRLGAGRAPGRRLPVGRHPAPPGPRRLRPHRRLRRRHRGLVRRAGAADSADSDAILPPTIHLALERAGSLRYGENPHQHGARYRIVGRHSWWDEVVQHGGKELSYLNIFDADAAWRLVHELAEPGGAERAVAIIKHANPCGAAVRPDLVDAPTSGPSSATPSRPSAGSWPSGDRSQRRWPTPSPPARRPT